MKNPFKRKKNSVKETDIKDQFVKDTLDRIGKVYSESVKTVETWNKSASYVNRSQSIPILALRQITLALKMKLDEKVLKELPVLKEQQKRTNDLIELIYKSARDDAKKMNQKSLPLDTLKDYKDAIIKGFKEGIEEGLKK